MHTLHTTDAFILSSAPHGESNRIYRLLTATHGLVYAHVQSVRELKNRNRYALRTAHLTSVTLVRGREVWRVTSARTLVDRGPVEDVAYRKMLDLVGRLAPVEEPNSRTFRILYATACAFACESADERPLVEILGILRILAELGYVPVRGSGAPVVRELCSVYDDYASTTLCRVREHRPMLVLLINNALEEAQT